MHGTDYHRVSSIRSGWPSLFFVVVVKRQFLRLWLNQHTSDGKSARAPCLHSGPLETGHGAELQQIIKSISNVEDRGRVEGLPVFQTSWRQFWRKLLTRPSHHSWSATKDTTRTGDGNKTIGIIIRNRTGSLLNVGRCFPDINAAILQNVCKHVHTLPMMYVQTFQYIDPGTCFSRPSSQESPTGQESKSFPSPSHIWQAPIWHTWKYG